MSREVALEAVWPINLAVDGKTADIRYIEYTRRWFDRLFVQNQEVEPGGRLTLGYWTAHRWMIEGLKKVVEEGGNVFITDEENICGEPDALCRSILAYWDQWHEEDERWQWSPETIRDFFRLHQRAIVYVYVY